MASKQSVKIRSGVKPAVELDLDSLSNKQGMLADVLAEICREHMDGDPMGQDLSPGRIDIELRSGKPGEITEQALQLSADWQTKVLPVLRTSVNVELGMAHHVEGGQRFLAKGGFSYAM